MASTILVSVVQSPLICTSCKPRSLAVCRHFILCVGGGECAVTNSTVRVERVLARHLTFSISSESGKSVCASLGVHLENTCMLQYDTALGRCFVPLLRAYRILPVW